ncbi:MAG: hypothetical protein Q7T18_10200 [Sedimentisphaerales bacterium]|nr:hypothetical protein [Sedimentisphaerales bacterium]
MKKETNENLSELLTQFLDADQASKAANVLAAGEQIFDAHPAPAPSFALIADIKRHMMAAASRKSRRTSRFTKRIAAAAIILLALGAGITLLQKNSSQISSVSFWQETPDNSLAVQLTQLDQAENDAPVITLEVNGSDMAPMNDITDELNEIEGTFWEG